MAALSRSEKIRKNKIDKQIDRFYRDHSAGKSINVMDIGKVFAAGHEAAAGCTIEAIEAGTSIENAVKAAIDKLCFKS